MRFAPSRRSFAYTLKAAMIDVGSGPPIVMIPGSQGRWEWMRPAIAALSGRCRTLAYSLCGEPGSGMEIDGGLGFDSYVTQLDAVLDQAGLENATICGVSYGGWIAVRYAAHRPHRVRSLILVSAPGPIWQPDARAERYLTSPRMLFPLFVVSSAGRLYPEIARALPDWRKRIPFSVRHTLQAARAPLSPPRTAERVRLRQKIDLVPDCALVNAPTMLVTGEEDLDQVVPVASTRQYEKLIGDVVWRKLPDTGHLGHITRPDIFAGLVTRFIDETETRPVRRLA